MRVGLLIGTFALLWVEIPAPAGTVLWYNGDLAIVSGVSGWANERNTKVTESAVYDNFVVPAPGWLITAVFSNNQSTFETIAGADWEIRQGLAPGHGGTLIASGTGVPASWTTTGRFSGGALASTEYRLYVSGLHIYLPPGSYWLMVRPVGFGSGLSFLSTTSGANGVNAVIDGDWFIDSTYYEYDFVYRNEGGFDFSMGLEGAVVPEPATLGLAAAGLALVILGRRKLSLRCLMPGRSGC